MVLEPWHARNYWFITIIISIIIFLASWDKPSRNEGIRKRDENNELQQRPTIIISIIISSIIIIIIYTDKWYYV